ncbi:ATP-binding protein [Curtobacterium sp. USHLN213]|uniref:ATP-binding protein n=1 Tax=Curtobacterium sp. USHLN213 TaxID=3081255 RepID=UPI00301B6ABC
MLQRDQLEPFKTALTNALRTTKHDDDALSDRFIELTPGLITSLEANVNHLLTGRRGVGKSTTLSILHQRAESKGRRVIFVDVEEHKSRDYPDVLIEIISTSSARSGRPGS